MQSDKDQHETLANDWDACPQGELSQMVTRLDTVKRAASRKRIYRGTLACTALFALVVFSVGSFLGENEPLMGGIRCAVCHSNFEAYHDHLTETALLADAELIASMKIHLEKCVLCRDKFNMMYPGVLPNNLSATGYPIHVAVRPTFSIGGQNLLY